MKISELITRLQKLMDEEGDQIIVVDSENSNEYVDVLDVVGKNYTNRNKFFSAYLVIDEPLCEEEQDTL